MPADCTAERVSSRRHLELRDALDLSYGTRPKREDDRAAEICLEAVPDVSRKGGQVLGQVPVSVAVGCCRWDER